MYFEIGTCIISAKSTATGGFESNRKVRVWERPTTDEVVAPQEPAAPVRSKSVRRIKEKQCSKLVRCYHPLQPPSIDIPHEIALHMSQLHRARRIVNPESRRQEALQTLFKYAGKMYDQSVLQLIFCSVEYCICVLLCIFIGRSKELQPIMNSL